MLAPQVKPSHQEVDTPLLTLSAVRELKASYDADLKLYEELPARIEAKRKRLDAAMLFLPDGVSLDAPAALPADDDSPTKEDEDSIVTEFALRPPKDAGTKLTWVGEVERVLREAGRGLTHQELMQEIMKTELASRVSDGAKGFYRAIGALSERRLLIKNGSLLFHSNVAAQIEAAGQELPAGENGRVIGTPALILKVLSEAPTGLTGPQMRDAVAHQDGATSSARDHGQYVYNCAKSLIDRGLVAKRLGVYRVTPKGKEGVFSAR